MGQPGQQEQQPKVAYRRVVLRESPEEVLAALQALGTYVHQNDAFDDVIDRDSTFSRFASYSFHLSPAALSLLGRLADDELDPDDRLHRLFAARAA